MNIYEAQLEILKVIEELESPIQRAKLINVRNYLENIESYLVDLNRLVFDSKKTMHDGWGKTKGE